jgi:CheY-like chemotaxis protein
MVKYIGETVKKMLHYMLFFLKLSENIIRMERMLNKEKNKILIVDDDPIIREILFEATQMKKYNVETAFDGLEAWEKFQKCPQSYQALVIDAVMPRMDGKELYYKAKSLKPEIKIIVISGYSKNGVREELETAGIEGFLEKPFNVTSFFGLLESII